MILALILIPTVAGLLAFSLRHTAARRGLLLLTALTHTSLTALTWWQQPAPWFSNWLMLDAPGRLFLSITTLLFLAAAIYTIGYLKNEARAVTLEDEEGFFFTNAPEAVFIGCLLIFLAAMTLVTVSQHFSLLWIAVETTTLASAPLIYFHRHHRSLEATWKYLLICSVGIALALLGNFFLAVAATPADGAGLPLVVSELARPGTHLRTTWLEAAFILLLVGYGTKMGLAPLHTWLPDAHSESPSVISALLSGALLNCAFLGILRAFQVCAAAGLARFAQDLLLVLGLLSMVVAAAFIFGQTDYKRLLAYSSVEHMGILALGVGLGGAGAFGAMLHGINHSITKAMLFLVAGNVLAVYKTKAIADVRGVLHQMPASGVLWVAGFFAITGTPPFGPFLSELTILKAAFDQERAWIGVIYLALLGIIFIGMASATLGMAQGRPQPNLVATPKALNFFFLAPPLVLGCLVLMLGFYIPAPLRLLLQEAARTFGGS